MKILIPIIILGSPAQSRSLPAKILKDKNVNSCDGVLLSCYYHYKYYYYERVLWYRRRHHLEEISTEGTGRVVAGIEPAKQTFRVKPLPTGATLLAWQLVGRAVKHRVADVAFLHALEVLVHVPLPQLQAVGHRTVLDEFD